MYIPYDYIRITHSKTFSDKDDYITTQTHEGHMIIAGYTTGPHYMTIK